MILMILLSTCVPPSVRTRAGKLHKSFLAAPSQEPQIAAPEEEEDEEEEEAATQKKTYIN